MRAGPAERDAAVLPAPVLSLPSLAGQMLVCSLLWSTTFLFLKDLGASLSPLALAALRGLMGGGLLGLWLLGRWRLLAQPAPWPHGREWGDWALLGLLQGAVPNGLTAYALLHLPAGLTALIQSTVPLAVAVLAHLVFPDERLGWQRALGVLTGFAGMAVLLGPDVLAGGAGLFGVLAMAVTVASYAVGNLAVRAIPVAEPLRLAFGQQAFSGLIATALVLPVGGLSAVAPAREHLAALLGLGVIATALPIPIYMAMLRGAGPTLGSMYSYLVPVWALLLAALLLHEPVTAREVAGGLIVLAGLVAVALTRRRPVEPVAPAPPVPPASPAV